MEWGGPPSHQFSRKEEIAIPRIRRTSQAPLDAKTWCAARYARLSREDGDKPESDSIVGQTALMDDYLLQHPELTPGPLYTDDGYTGTSFDRPGFQQMIKEIEDGKVDCVLVKDLSRFGREYIEMGRYLERWFPEHGVRFIAINDGIDSEQGPYDMLLPVKNVFNEQYAKDISRKVKSAVRTKQKKGAFIGAFPSYGYRKDPENHNKLVIDPCAAPVVARIFDLFESGMGKVRIAKLLNAEKIPCPSEYKRLNGERYNNGRRIQNTTYWTYATIHRMLQNQMYAGHMEQGRSVRQALHGKAKKLDSSQWVVVEDTHEAIIGPEQWARVQDLLDRDTRTLDFERNVSPLAGFLRCGDCGRAMSKTKKSNGFDYCCGSYKRYGPTVCSRHGISQATLEEIVLSDLNCVIEAVEDLQSIAEQACPRQWEQRGLQAERERCRGGLDRLYRLKKTAYEDYIDGIVSRDDYIKYKADYERQETQLGAQMARLQAAEEDTGITHNPWVENLLRHGRLTELDRATLAETVECIQVFEEGRLEITYKFSDDLGVLGTKEGDIA